MSAIVIEHVPVAEVPAERRARLRGRILALVEPCAEARYAVIYSLAGDGDGGRYHDTHSLANIRCRFDSRA